MGMTALKIVYLWLACLALGCSSDSKFKQIQDGVENVDQYAQEIEKEAQP